MKSINQHILATAAVMLASLTLAQAQSGTWISTTIGSWSDTTRWNNSIVASGAGNTADFSQLDITAANTVTLDGNRTVGRLLVADLNPNFDWTFNDGGAGNVLTLDNGGSTPFINVSNRSAFVNFPLAGTGGFQFGGSGTLRLSATNTITGTIIVGNGLGGTLNLFNFSVLPMSVALPQSVNLTLGGAAFNFAQQTGSAGAVGYTLANIGVNPGQSFIGNTRISGGRVTNYFTGTLTRSAGGTLDFPTYDLTRTLTYMTNSAVATNILLSSGVPFATASGFLDWAGKAGGAYTGGGQAATVGNPQTGGGGTGNNSISFSTNTATAIVGNPNLAAGVTNVTIDVAVPTTTLAADAAITSLRFATNGGRTALATVNQLIDLGGFNLTVGGILMNNGITTGSLTISNGVLRGIGGQDLVIIQNGAGVFRVYATIADNGSATALTKSAGQTLQLLGNNTYSGVTYLNAGTLQVGNGGTTGDLGNSPTVQGQSGTLIFNRSDALTYGGTLLGPIALTKSGAGTLTLTADSSLYGAVTINAGTLQLGNGGASGSLSNASSIANSGTLAVNRSASLTYSRNITGNGAVVNQGSGSLTLGAGLNGVTATLANTGSGSIILNSTNNYGGNTLISSGSLILGANASITNTPSIFIGSGARLDVSALPGGLILNPSALIAQTIYGSGVVTGSVTTVGSSAISPGTNGVIGSLSISNTLTLAGGVAKFDITSLAVLDQIRVGGALALSSGTIAINVTGGPIPNGAYTLINYPIGSLSGSINNLSVSFSQAGSIADLDDSVPGQIRLIVSSATPNNLVWQGGVSSDWDSITTNWLNSLTLTNYAQHDNVTLDDSAVTPNVSLTGVIKPGIITVSNDVQSYVISASSPGNRLSGSASLVKNGPGSLTILAVNDYTAPTAINAGTVSLGNGTTDGSLGVGSVTNNATLEVNSPNGITLAGGIAGSGQLINTSGTNLLTGANTFTGPTIINGGGLQVGIGGPNGTLGAGIVTNNAALIFNRSGALTVNNLLTGSGTVNFIGSGSVTLGANNTYINNTYINNGTVKLGLANAIPNGGPTTGWLVLDGGTTAGVLDLNGFDQTVNAISGIGGTINGLVTNSAASPTVTNVITINTTGTTNTYAGGFGNSASGSKLRVAITGTGGVRFNGISTHTGDTVLFDTTTLIFGPGANIGNNGTIIMTNGSTFSMVNNGGTGSFPGNTLVLPAGGAATLNSSSAGNGYGGNIIGGSTSTNILTGAISANNTTKQFQSMLGTVVIGSGNSLRFSSTSLNVNGGDFTTFDLSGGSINTRNGTGTGAGVSLGALQGTSGSSLNGAGNADGNGIYIIGAKGIDTVFSGAINGVVPRNTSIVKTGAGRLTLDGTLAYDGSTTINNGVLAIASAGNPATSLDASPTITITSNAVLDVSARTDGTLNLGNTIPQILAGYGIIRGSLFEAATTTNNLLVGTMQITNSATIDGALNMQINRTNSPNCSQLSALSFVNGGSIVLNVANVGPTNLAAGDTFQLFNQAFPGSFLVTNLPALPSNQLYWTNRISLNGSIAVASAVNLTPTNLTTSVSGNTLTISWPTSHIGWRLQVQTNNLASGLSRNTNDWMVIPGTASVNTTNLTIDPAKPASFYRLVYP